MIILNVTQNDGFANLLHKKTPIVYPQITCPRMNFTAFCINQNQITLNIPFTMDVNSANFSTPRTTQGK